MGELEQFKIYDFYPNFKRYQLIVIRLPQNKLIRGKFLKWEDEENKSLGKMIIIERDYNNYIHSLAIMLDEHLISVQEFYEEIKKENYEKKKVISISNEQIYTIDNIPFKKPT